MSGQETGLEARPISLRDANDFVARHHRHHKPVHGQKYSVSAWRNDALVGVAIVGRPVARNLDDGLTAEVTRLCTDGSKNVCSFLLSRAARMAGSNGYRTIGTYTLASETGSSLRAAGWQFSHETKGGEWSRPSRTRNAAARSEPKHYWTKSLTRNPACSEHTKGET